MKLPPADWNRKLLRDETIISWALMLLIRGVSVLAILAACNSAVDPGTSVAGLYALEQVDGVLVSAPSIGATAACPVAITDGVLALQSKSDGTPQFYSIVAYASPTCESNGIPTDPTAVVDDAGTWSKSGSALHFVSSPYKRQGAYDGTVADAPSSIGTLAVTVEFSGHSYRFARLDGDRSALITVDVLDQTGAQVGGALVVVRFSDREVIRSFSDNKGFPPGISGGSPGPARISVAPPSGYSFASGQENPRTVTLVSQQITRVVVTLVRAAP